MWPRRSHLLAPLTALTGKGTFTWTAECQHAFDEMRRIIAEDVLLVYPDVNQPFDIYTDASDYQMGAAIIQNGRPVAYWSRKLSDAQRNYSTMEKELLAVVYCLCEFQSFLYGAQLNIYTDHRNLTFKTLNTDRVLRWRLFLEEYDAKFYYIQGKDNVLADCFSRLPRMDKPSTDAFRYRNAKIVDFLKLHSPKSGGEEDDPLHDLCNYYFSAETPCTSLSESYLNIPARNNVPNPVDMITIQQHQFTDGELNHRRQTEPHLFPVHYIQQRPVICYLKNGDPPDRWLIALPTALLTTTLLWYHLVLGHCGKTRLYETIRSRFYHPQLKQECDRFNCRQCQHTKALGQGYGHLPPRTVTLAPWNEVAVDLIGPWKLEVNDQHLEFNALTCIDPVTNLVELVRTKQDIRTHQGSVRKHLAGKIPSSQQMHSRQRWRIHRRTLSRTT
jgi:RNase H-like domain found in reverse transcriptase/Integrase zinc binding domain